MEQVISKLITDCVALEKEKKGFGILLALNQREITKYVEKETLRQARIMANEEIENLGGINEVDTKYSKASKGYVEKFSALAAFLDEEEGFDDVERFRAQLSEEQFSWLKSHVREIKNYL